MASTTGPMPKKPVVVAGIIILMFGLTGRALLEHHNLKPALEAILRRRNAAWPRADHTHPFAARHRRASRCFDDVRVLYRETRL